MRHASLVPGSRPEASLALAAVREALAARTASFGSAAVANADGSRTIIGAGGVELGTTADLRWLTASGNFSLRNLRMQLSRVQQTLADGGVVSNTSRMNQISIDPPPASTTGYSEGAFWTQVESATSLVAKAIWRVEDGAWVQKDLGASTLITPTMDAGLIDAAAVAAKLIVSGEMWSAPANPRFGMTADGFQGYDALAEPTVRLNGSSNYVRGTTEAGRMVMKRWAPANGTGIGDLTWKDWASVTGTFATFGRRVHGGGRPWFRLLPSSMTWDTAPATFTDLDFEFDPSLDYDVPEHVSGPWTRDQLRAFAAAAVWLDDGDGTSALYRDLNGLGYLAPEAAAGILPALVWGRDGALDMEQQHLSGRSQGVHLTPAQARLYRTTTGRNGGGVPRASGSIIRIEDGGVNIVAGARARVTGLGGGQWGWTTMATDFRMHSGEITWRRGYTASTNGYDPAWSPDERLIWDSPNAAKSTVSQPGLLEIRPALARIVVSKDAAPFYLKPSKDLARSASGVASDDGTLRFFGTLRNESAPNPTFQLYFVHTEMQDKVKDFTQVFNPGHAALNWNAVVTLMTRNTTALGTSVQIIERTQDQVKVRWHRQYAQGVHSSWAAVFLFQA